MKPQIIHKSSKSVETVGTVILVYGALLTLAGVIIAIAAEYQAWPGLIVAGYGISSILIGVVVKGASVIVRASETYLFDQDDHEEGSVEDLIERQKRIEQQAPNNGVSYNRVEKELAEKESKNTVDNEPYNPYKDNKV